jgi:hypothetical protein
VGLDWVGGLLAFGLRKLAGNYIDNFLSEE